MPVLQDSEFTSSGKCKHSRGARLQGEAPGFT